MKEKLIEVVLIFCRLLNKSYKLNKLADRKFNTPKFY
jgi:hypothetical protein